jgi:hypothetical protein
VLWPLLHLTYCTEDKNTHFPGSKARTNLTARSTVAKKRHLALVGLWTLAGTALAFLLASERRYTMSAMLKWCPSAHHLQPDSGKAMTC